MVLFATHFHELVALAERLAAGGEHPRYRGREHGALGRPGLFASRAARQHLALVRHRGGDDGRPAGRRDLARARDRRSAGRAARAPNASSAAAAVDGARQARGDAALARTLALPARLVRAERRAILRVRRKGRLKTREVTRGERKGSSFENGSIRDFDAGGCRCCGGFGLRRRGSTCGRRSIRPDCSRGVFGGGCRPMRRLSSCGPRRRSQT